MEDTVNLKTKSTPSSSIPATEKLNQLSSVKSSQIRDQLRLSSSQGVAFPAGSSSPLITSISALTEPVRVTPASKHTQLTKVGVSVPSSNTTTVADAPSRTSVQPHQRKNSEKNRVPFVISFSDDDSSSESEEPIQEKTLETKYTTNGTVGNKRPLVSSIAKSQTLQQPTTQNTKAVPRKVPLSRTFVSSMTKINGVSPRNSRPVTRVDTLNKTKAGREVGNTPNIHLNSSKLHDLRQLIAIRENELKLKATQQNKETVSASFKDSSNIENLSNGGARISREPSAEFLPSEPEKKRQKVNEANKPLVPDSDGRQNKETLSASFKDYNDVENLGNGGARISREPSSEFLPSEPEKKRQKVNEVNTPLVPDSDGRQDMPGVEAVLGSEKELEGFHQHNVDQVQNRVIVCSASVPSSMNNGNDLVIDSTQCNSVTKMVDPSVSNRTTRTSPEKSQKLEPSHHHQLNIHQKSSSLPNSSVTKKSPGRNYSKKIHALKVGSIDNAVNPVPDHQAFSLTPKVIPDPAHVSLNKGSERNNSQHQSNVIVTTNNMDLQSLMELEELQDKELEEAQQIRRKCEIEERIALKAYRKAQRASFEADARCAQIYRQRELISTQIRSLYLKDSSLLWSSRSQVQVPELNMHLLPSSSHQMQFEVDAQNQNGSDSDVRYIDQQKDTQSASESDASTSDPLKGSDGVGNVLFSQTNVSNTSEDEDLFSSDRKSGPSNQDDGMSKDLNEESKTLASSDDSLRLEASLRSQLFSKLGIKDSVEKGAPVQSIDPVDERRIQNYGGEETDAIIEKITFSEAGKDQHHMDLDDIHVVESASFLSPTWRSAFEHVMISDDAIEEVQSETRKTHIQTLYNEDSNSLIPNATDPINMSTESINLTEICVGKGGYYTNNLAIDPVWPLCMYELRGRCNDDECCMQHVRDYSQKDINLENSENSESGAAKNIFKSNDLITAAPTYIVCANILQADNHHSYESFAVARSVGKCWRKRFSVSLVLSCLLSLDLPSDEPFLHGTEARIEVHGDWNCQSSHLHRRVAPLGLLEQHLTGNDHSLEVALLNLGQEANKHKGRIEALKVLARALEADPTCVVLWIVYLHIYYGNQISVGDDDMFHWAVVHNKGSYELWLMYINSRVHLGDCLAAYKAALSALCCIYASTSGTDAIYASESILDIFLQMIYCMCTSGKMDTALQMIYSLDHSSYKSDDSHCPTLHDIFTHLTVHDQCILWVSCFYLSIYKKLPDDIVRSFECCKDHFTIDWPSADLTVNEKQQSIKLMEMAADSIAVHIDTKSALKAAHFFAPHHVRCTAVLQGLECSRNLLEKYIKLYPSCVELVLISARAVSDFQDSYILGFEEPLCQRIWNQYAESALQSGKLELAKGIMGRWFQSFQSKNLNDIYGLLNFALYKILEGDPKEAISAIDHALASASPEDYMQIVMEHASFFASISKSLNLLNRYLIDTRAISASEPLSRKFIQTIKKPRVQQLVSNLLTPLSSDYSLLNSVLKVWYGPSLLPSNVELVNLVKLVESVMEICPANYPVAISLCKVLTGVSSGDLSGSFSFWASSLLVNALFQAVPVAPEYVWVEAADVLQKLSGRQPVSDSFHRRALSVYPFSLCLWESYLKFSRINGDANAVIEAARERGIKL